MKIKDKKGIRGFARWTITDLEGNILRQSDWIENLVPNGRKDTGVGIIFQHLLGDTTNPLKITDGMIGTGETIPNDNDTSLETEIISVTPSISQKENNTTILFSFYFPNAILPNADYNEFGMKANTQLFSRLIFIPKIKKSAGENTTVDYRLEITNT